MVGGAKSNSEVGDVTRGTKEEVNGFCFFFKFGFVRSITPSSFYLINF